MKKIALLLCIVLVISLFSGCNNQASIAQVAATTLPVYEFTLRLCEGTGISVTRLVTEEVSCLHDYSLKTEQMRSIEGAELIVMNGGGLEDFLEDVLAGQQVIDASTDMQLSCGTHEHEGHGHDHDPHFWLSPAHARIMVHNIAQGLAEAYPEHTDLFLINEDILFKELNELERYGKEQLAGISTRKLITFHDGFSYFAECYDLEIIKAIEEESGSEASAQELIEIIELVEKEQLPAIFIERSGSDSAARIIANETGTKVCILDMAMSGDSYFTAMHNNIKTVKEALG